MNALDRIAVALDKLYEALQTNIYGVYQHKCLPQYNINPENKTKSDNTTVRMCVCTDCVNNRAGLGECECNCKEIEIQEGKCRQYIKQQNPPLKIT